MKYVHKLTKAVIETECIINSKNWVRVEEDTPRPKRKNTKKSGEK